MSKLYDRVLALSGWGSCTGAAGIVEKLIYGLSTGIRVMVFSIIIDSRIKYKHEAFISFMKHNYLSIKSLKQKF